MAEKKKQTSGENAEAVAAVKKEAKPETRETKYTLPELINAGLSNADKVISAAALKSAGKTEYTEAEAIKIINDFKNKEVS